MDVILIAGDYEDVRCGFGEAEGVEHAEVVKLPIPPDLLQRLAADDVSHVLFLPAPVAPREEDATRAR